VGAARARTHARSTVQPANDECEERVRDTVGGDNAGYRLTGCDFLSPTSATAADIPTTPGANSCPVSPLANRYRLVGYSCSLQAILAISFNRLPTSVPASSPPLQSLHNSGFFRIQVSGSTVLHHPRNVIVRPFGTVPTGFRGVHIASHRQRTGSAERWTAEQGM